MLREQASKLLQQARNRNSEIGKKKEIAAKPGPASSNSKHESQEKEEASTSVETNSLENDEAPGHRKGSLSQDIKSNPFTLVRKKQLKELSPRHFLKEKKTSLDSGQLFVVLFIADIGLIILVLVRASSLPSLPTSVPKT